MTAHELFSRTEAVLEYRPVKTIEGWEWNWVLLPLPAEDEALAYGCAATRGVASIKARNEARRLGRRITKVRVSHQALNSKA